MLYEGGDSRSAATKVLTLQNTLRAAGLRRTREQIAYTEQDSFKLARQPSPTIFGPSQTLSAPNGHG